MGEQQKRGDDASDHAPKPKTGETGSSGKPGKISDKQDGSNYDDLEDGGRAVPVEDMNSANDE